MSTLDEIFGDGQGIKDLRELEQAHKDVQKLKRIGGVTKKRAKKPRGDTRERAGV